jgi:hypothetical protein
MEQSEGREFESRPGQMSLFFLRIIVFLSVMKAGFTSVCKGVDDALARMLYTYQEAEVPLFMSSFSSLQRFIGENDLRSKSLPIRWPAVTAFTATDDI